MNDYSNKVAPKQLTEKRRISILDLSHKEAREFFLKSECYCDFDLPRYFVFSDLILKVNEQLVGQTLAEFSNNPREFDDVNYTILNNKDGKYAWRPLQLINPALYVALVHSITEENNWKHIINKFKEFSNNEKILCQSLPVISLSDETDKAEQISHWVQEVEQRSIELALEYDCLIETDITDCYSSLYTHTIAWAIHGKEEAKDKRKDQSLIGNKIDKYIQDMHQGQTNGIPQGSVLMDFFAEMILGYIDLILSEKLKSVVYDYQILRYRDDYRIFVNNPREGEQIIKLLTEITLSLGLKLNPLKTQVSIDVVRGSIKPDKIAWFCRKNREKILQKHLLIIHDHSLQFPNAGSLIVSLEDFNKRLERFKYLNEKPLPLISIVVDIAYHNPRTYSVCAAILSKLLTFVEANEKRGIIKKIQHKFTKIPNTGHLQIWLQRISYPVFKDIEYDERLCQLVAGHTPPIWNIDWICSKNLKGAIDANSIIDKEYLNTMGRIIPYKEIGLFNKRQMEGYYG